MVIFNWTRQAGFQTAWNNIKSDQKTEKPKKMKRRIRRCKILVRYSLEV
jgi:hypothetical protein